MRNTAKRTISAFLALALLALSIPFFALGASAEMSDGRSELRLLDASYDQSGAVRHSNTSVTLNAKAGTNRYINVSLRPTDTFVNNAVLGENGAGGSDSQSFYNGLSFTMQKNTAESPNFYIRAYPANKKVVRMLDVANSQLKVSATGQVLCEIGSDPIDVYLGIKWTDGGKYLSFDVYLNGVYSGTYNSVSANAAFDTVVAFQLYSDKGQNDSVAGASMTLSNVYEHIGRPMPGAYILPGASMRLEETAAASGLRFEFNVDRAWYESLSDASVGAFIVPSDLMAGKSMTGIADLEAAGAIHMENIGLSEDASTEEIGCYYASLVSILEKNYAREFSAIGYVKSGDDYYFTGVQSRSVYEVAVNATVSGDYEGGEKESLIDGYLGKVVSLGADFSVEAILNYTSPFVGAASGNGFTIVGEGVSEIKAIIIGGEVYTKGWTVEGNTLTVASYSAE